MNQPEVFRAKVKEHRGSYFVEYLPATPRRPVAILALVFPSQVYDLEAVVKAMETELVYWLNRYHVPLTVSSFDAKDDLVSLPTYSHLTGYFDPKQETIIQRWGRMEPHELPHDQTTYEHLQKVYKDIPFRLASEVRANVEREARSRKNVVYTILFFTAVIPTLIEFVSLGWEWLRWLLEGTSIIRGLYEIGSAFGWIKPTQSQIAKAEKKRKMAHYYYHCERNPEAFLRLKVKNFENEAIARIRKEEEAIKKSKRPA